VIRRLAAVGWLLAGWGCTNSGDPRCDAYVFTEQGGAATHVGTCGDPGCGNGLNPPTAGAHCGTTTTCRPHDVEVSRCIWLHNLEHGHAVLAYNCPEGCPEIVAALEEIWDAAPAPKRVLITPDPALPAKVAAVVWGYGHTSETVDAEAIGCLMQHQDELAPEAGLGCPQ